MRAVVQRVRSASVDVEGKRVAAIGPGLLILVGAQKDDVDADAEYLAQKCAQLRIFEDDAGKMNLSILDKGYEALVVSQFTLLGDVRKGRRPSFDGAMEPPGAERLVRRFIEYLGERGIDGETIYKLCYKNFMRVFGSV